MSKTQAVALGVVLNRSADQARTYIYIYIVPVARWKRGSMSYRRQKAGMTYYPRRHPADEMACSMQREEEALRLQAGVHPSQ